jgi:hypothetical protein
MPRKKKETKKKPKPTAAPEETHVAPPPAVGPIVAEETLEQAEQEVVELDMDYWRSLAREALPDTAGPWEESEMGACFQQMVKLIKQHYTKIDEIARDSEEKTLIFGIKFAVVRKKTPGQVKMDISYSQNWKDNAKVQVPDPDQNELPLAVVKGDSKHQADPEKTEAEEEEAEAIRQAEIEEQAQWQKEQDAHNAKNREREFDQKTGIDPEAGNIDPEALDPDDEGLDPDPDNEDPNSPS